MTRDTRNEKGNLQDAKKGCAVYQLKRGRRIMKMKCESKWRGKVITEREEELRRGRGMRNES